MTKAIKAIAIGLGALIVSFGFAINTLTGFVILLGYIERNGGF